MIYIQDAYERKQIRNETKGNWSYNEYIDNYVYSLWIFVGLLTYHGKETDFDLISIPDRLEKSKRGQFNSNN